MICNTIRSCSSLILACLDHCIRVDTFPVCSYSQAGCPLPLLADVFDRVIQQSSKMHAASSDLHSEYERYFLPSRKIIGKRKCHSYGIPTPDDKENAQNLGVREQLTEVILRLLRAWTDPLSRLYRSMSQGQNKDLNLSGSDKALEMSEMVRELREGVAKVAEKMKLLGVIRNSVGYITPHHSGPSAAVSFYKQGELDPGDHQDLLYCFKRDSNKVKNYLRILKCTTLPGLDC
uniref:Prolactin-like n=1 Tax=Takifugu rubripes TaxID=31033 RepID=H2V0I1_TAKRU